MPPEPPAGAGEAPGSLARLRPPAATRYHACNPATKLTLSGVALVVALVVPGATGPLAALALLAGPVVWARLVRRISLLGAQVSAPLAVLAGLERFTLGSRSAGVAAGSAPWNAAAVALDVLLRVAAVTAAAALFAWTTDRRAMALDLERRGVPHGLVFGVLGLLGLAPAVRERVGQITAAQRARGLAIGRGPWGAFRARLPLVFPTLVSAINDWSEGSLAMESRASGRPGRRTLLWWPPDPPLEGRFRTALLGAVLLVIAARLGGWLA